MVKDGVKTFWNCKAIGLVLEPRTRKAIEKVLCYVQHQENTFI